MTGPFVSQGNGSFEMLLSVQHPGEINGPGQGKVQRNMKIANSEGEVFNQLRTIPIGSNWPHDETRCPRSAIIQSLCIRES